jgi:hypothetical protein
LELLPVAFTGRIFDFELPGAKTPG